MKITIQKDSKQIQTKCDLQLKFLTRALSKTNLNNDIKIKLDKMGFCYKKQNSRFLDNVLYVGINLDEFNAKTNGTKEEQKNHDRLMAFEASESIKIQAHKAIKRINGTNYINIFYQSQTCGFDDEKRDYKPQKKSDYLDIFEGLFHGAYAFKKYKNKKKQKKANEKPSKTLYVLTTKQNEIKEFNDIKTILNGVNLARDFVNTPPQDFYPKTMSKEAKKIATNNKLECKVYDEKYLKKQKMGAMLAVGRASRHESNLIHLKYTPTKPNKNTIKIVFVGKGLTYDSGGLSLKPADYMQTMKSDKGGACAILGAMSALSKLNINAEIHGVLGAVENMIGGDAYKPDDVLKAKDGTMIEIGNTDAEGRLVLADCLCWSQDNIKDFDYIIDLATLTGACVVGVGEFTTGIMGNNNHFNKQIADDMLNAGELNAILPFNRYLKETIKSEIADISNIASTRYGGTITAGLFLEHFITKENKQKWVHLDIAGPAFVQKAWGYNPYGASGAGVRSIINFITNRSSK
jgi:leucyl aminopeptidase